MDKEEVERNRNENNAEIYPLFGLYPCWQCLYIGRCIPECPEFYRKYDFLILKSGISLKKKKSEIHFVFCIIFDCKK